jgi:hypothetical protein
MLAARGQGAKVKSQKSKVKSQKLKVKTRLGRLIMKSLLCLDFKDRRFSNAITSNTQFNVKRSL